MGNEDSKEPSGHFNPGPGTAHEIGVMIGFILVFFIVSLGYLLFWKIGNRKEEMREWRRRQQLREKASNTRSSNMGDTQDIFDVPADPWEGKGAVKENLATEN